MSDTLRDAFEKHGDKVFPAMQALRETLKGQRTSVALTASLMVAAEVAYEGRMTQEGFMAAAKMAFDSQVAAAEKRMLGRQKPS